VTADDDLVARLRRALQDERTASTRLMAQMRALQDENAELHAQLAAGKATIKRLANLATAAGLLSGDEVT